jgi:acetyl-CoA acetyltransferase
MSVIVGGARTGIGRLLGSLKDVSAVELGATAIRGALEKSGVSASDVDYVIMGHVLQAELARCRHAKQQLRLELDLMFQQSA